MSGAGEAVLAAAMAGLRAIEGLGVFEPAPVQASVPYATVEIGSERDWSHKSGAGRELRLVAVLRDKGERPVRLRMLMGEAEAALAAMGSALGAWRLVTMHHLRSRVVREPRGPWAGVIEFRARLLAD